VIGIIDYGCGNIYSVLNALEYIGEEAFLSSDANELQKADGFILPGVGAFPDAVKNLKEGGLWDFVLSAAKTKPLLGICLGMQLLFSKSYEFSECEGLSLIEGEIKKINFEGLKIPHMGWNDIRFFESADSCPLLNGISENTYMYFVHSFRAHAKFRDNVAASAYYGEEIPALVYRDNVFGCQFHPEKSGDSGLMILKNFCKFSREQTK